MSEKFVVYDPATECHAPYVELAKRTAVALDPRMNLLHSVSGLACETAEVFNCYSKSLNKLVSGQMLPLRSSGAFRVQAESRDELIKEMGDVCWFIALFYDWRYLDEADFALYSDVHRLNDLADLDFNTALFILPHLSEQLGGWLKAEAFYGTKMETGVIANAVERCLIVLLGICKTEDILLIDVLTANVAKLAKRYKKGGYTKELSEAKIDKEET